MLEIWIFLIFVFVCSGLFYKYGDGTTGLDKIIDLFKKK